MITPTEWFSIHQLYARQSVAVDEGDAPGWASTFAESAVFTSPTFSLVARGRSELVEFARMSHARAAARGEQLRHIVSNQLILGLTDESAHIRAYLMIVATSAAGSRVDRMLVIEDRLERGPGAEWLFTSRETHRDAPPQIE